MVYDHTLSNRRKAVVLARTSLGFAITLTLYLTVISIALPGITPAKIAGAAATLIFYALAFIGWRMNAYIPTAHAFIISALGLAFMASMTNGGVSGYVAPFLIIAPLAAGFFLSVYAAMAYGAAAVGLLTLLFLLDGTGIITPTPYPESAERLASLFLLSTTTILGLACVLGFSSAVSRMLDEARKGERVKAAFLANMSHEIRTPMNGILGLLDLAKASRNRSMPADHVDIIHASATALVAVLDDILDISKLEQGQIEIAAEPTDLRELCDDVVQLFSARLTGSDVELRLEYDPALKRAYRVDPLRLRQVLWNLVGNAIKFTEKGHIIVHVGIADGEANRLRFSVEDTGIGMSEAAQARIFSRFSQADETTTRRFGGTGLGLAISRELTELMGGELGLKSAPGKGSTFWFTIKAEPSDLSETPADAEMSTQGSSLPILVVDDQAINRTVAAALLTHMGHKPVLAESGCEALDICERQAFEMILMDIHMPDLDGCQTTQLIRNGTSPNQNTPIYALTASALDEERERYFAAGMNGCLGKPIQLDTLKAAITTRHRPHSRRDAV